MSKPSAHVHPKLAMLQNGSRDVNRLRSGLTATVASADEAPPAEKTIAAAAASIGAIPYSMDDAVSFTTRQVPARLKKRPALSEAGLPEGVYVNVFVEVRQRRTTDSSEDQPEGLEDLTEALKGLVAQARNDGIPAAISRRQNLVAATVPIARTPDLQNDDRVAALYSAEVLTFDAPVSGEESAREPTGSGRQIDRVRRAGHDHRDGADVLIGIIDVGGFDFAHADFLDDDGNTRFEVIWDQGGDLRSSPRQFEYGSVLTRDQMNRAIAEEKAGGLPAHFLERQSQQVAGSHATHVASIAAGRSGVCPKAKIAGVLVSIPVDEDRDIERRKTFSDSSRIVHAIEYLLDLAEELGLPVSINISLGTNGGAHDGSSTVSRWIDNALTTGGRSVCLAAGNSGQEGPAGENDIGWIMGRIHTAGRVAARGLDVDLEWTVVGNGVADLSENELEIWYGAQDRFIVKVQPPGSTHWFEVEPREYLLNKRLPSGTTLSIFNQLYSPSNGANYIAIYLSPNLDLEELRGVEAGIWRIRIHGKEVRDGRFHGWIERDDPVRIGEFGSTQFFRFPSFFSSASNVDSHSISSLACGNHVIAVANHDDRTNRVNVSSSQGPTRDNRLKPDIAAPGTDILAANGFATSNNAWVEKTGTSMASPFVAGVVGLMMCVDRSLTAAQCIGILQRTSSPLPGSNFEWKNDAGFGRIDPEAAIAEAATFSESKEVR